jgi:hypothetical protein
MFGNQTVPLHIQADSDPNLELGRMLLFTHGIDLAKDIARNCGVTAHVDWVANTVTMTSQDPDLIAQAVQRFNKLEEFYVYPRYQLTVEPTWIAVCVLTNNVSSEG